MEKAMKPENTDLTSARTELTATKVLQGKKERDIYNMKC